MKISQRALSLTTSPIRRLGPYALEAEKAGKKVYHLNIGQPDIETPAQFMDAIRGFDKKVVAYGPSQGDPKLIVCICQDPRYPSDESGQPDRCRLHERGNGYGGRHREETRPCSHCG